MNRNWDFATVWAEQLFQELTSATESEELWSGCGLVIELDESGPSKNCDLDAAA
jgi:hypothetical protein